jgi:hypothetical protein
LFLLIKHNEWLRLEIDPSWREPEMAVKKNPREAGLRGGEVGEGIADQCTTSP